MKSMIFFILFFINAAISIIFRDMTALYFAGLMLATSLLFVVIPHKEQNEKTEQDTIK